MKKKFLIPMVLLLGLSVVSSCGENTEIKNDSTPSTESSSSSTSSETHTHEYSTTWSKDETSHWYSDTCGHNTRKDKSKHTYSDWTVVKAATTTEEGSERRECSVCGYEETRSVSKLKVNLTFNSNGGSAVDNVSLNCGEAIAVVPTKDNCLFLGWYDETFTTKYESAPQSDISLYAKWIDLSGYRYEVDGSNITIYEYIGSDTEVVIPEGVTSIGSFAFHLCTNLASVTIPNSVTSIGERAFEYCSNLRSVTIPNSVTSIGDHAFFNCRSLTSITISESVTSIGDNAFDECYKLVEVINKSSLNIEIGSKDFGMVGYYALEVKNSGESSIVNKDGYIFYTVDNINYLVGYTGNETSLVLPSDYNGESYIIYKYSFYEQNSLTSVILSSGVTNIGEYAFFGCSSLTNITIGNSLTSIGSQAFYRCYHLVEVINKSSLNIEKGSRDYGRVGYYALEVKNSGESSIVNNDGYIFYTVDNINYLVGYTGNETALVLPSNYNGESYVINDYAFYDCDSIISITIPDSVTSIGDSAFNFCKNLTNITMPYSVTSIGAYAFSYCSSLTSIVIPNGVRIITDRAFEYCENLTNVTIPNSVDTIGVLAFLNCSSLTSITLPNSVTSIREYAFEGCSSLTSIVIPIGVTSIGSEAFSGCSSLTSISISNSVENIYDGTFKGCNELKYNEYDNGYYLGNDTNPYLVLVKAKSSNITSCEINKNCKFIMASAFSNCSNLTSITIPDSVTSIGNCAFKGCSSLTSITIPNSVTRLGRYMFSNCSSLTSVVLPSMVSTIYGGSFRVDDTSTSITSVYFAGRVSDFWYKYDIRVDYETIYYYSETQPTDTDNKYWHYVDGEITEW